MTESSGLSRRSVLLGAVAAGATVAATGAPAGAASAAVPAGATVRRGDPRFPGLRYGNNKRFVAVEGVERVGASIRG